jgi:hypothetical protein
MAAGLFAAMKERYDVELVQEYVKTWAYLGRRPNEEDQVYIFGKQMYAESIPLSQGHIVITDSPLLMSVAYAELLNSPFAEPLHKIADEFERHHHSINFLLEPVFPYKPLGRFETEQQAASTHETIAKLMEYWQLNPILIKAGDVAAVIQILERGKA